MQRIEDAADYMADYMLEILVELRRKSLPEADVRLGKPRPCAPYMFKAMRALALRDAKALYPTEDDGGARRARTRAPRCRHAIRGDALMLTRASCASCADELEQRVTPIVSEKGGERPVDSFTVWDDATLNSVFDRAPVQGGAGDEAPLALVRAPSNSAAVKLTTPFKISWRTHRDDDGNVWGAKDVVAKAHIATLIEDHGSEHGVRFRTDDEAYEYRTGDVHAYKQAMAHALRAKPNGFSERYLQWADVVAPA